MAGRWNRNQAAEDITPDATVADEVQAESLPVAEEVQAEPTVEAAEVERAADGKRKEITVNVAEVRPSTRTLDTLKTRKTRFHSNPVYLAVKAAAENKGQVYDLVIGSQAEESDTHTLLRRAAADKTLNVGMNIGATVEENGQFIVPFAVVDKKTTKKTADAPAEAEAMEDSAN